MLPARALPFDTGSGLQRLRNLSQQDLDIARDGTCLGSDFLKDHRRLRMKPIRARQEDFERAVKDALYAGRLVAYGHSPFKLFMELNNIARNLSVASKTPQNIGK